VLIVRPHQVKSTRSNQTVLYAHVVARGSYRASLVEAANDIGKFFADAAGGGILIPLFSYFIADTPNENARVIAISQDHIFEVATVPFVPIEMVIEFRLLLLPHVKGFIHHDKTLAVGQVQ
jgi:hypothetical protein